MILEVHEVLIILQCKVRSATEYVILSYYGLYIILLSMCAMIVDKEVHVYSTITFHHLKERTQPVL